MMKKYVRIEFEEITLRLPKVVIDFIKRFYGDPRKHLEYDIVNLVKAEVEVTTGKELAEHFNLQQAFRAVLRETIQ